MPKVSVIIPTYNRADMVSDALQSVLQQTFCDWEIVVIDDGSSDHTHEVIAQYTDSRIRYIYQKNKGLPGARNTGIRTAQGEYIAFLDSDDLFLSNKLLTQTALLDARPDLGLVTGGYIEVDSQLRHLRELQPWHTQPALTFADWVMNCPICPSAPLVRRTWLEQVGLFDESMHRIEDWDLWLRMSHLGCTMEWLKQPVCLYRIHGGNMVRDVALMRVGMITMLDKLYSNQNLPADIVALREPAYAHVYLDAAARAYSAGAIEDGRNSLAEAVRLDPALLDGNPPRIYGSLASFALSPLCGDSQGFMKRVFDNLPMVQGLPRWSNHKTHAMLNAVQAFELHRSNHKREAAKLALQALCYDSAWLSNRGILAILRDGVLGR